MSKKLDEEYKSMVAAEVPDLWDRIEKSLPEKAPAAEVKTSKASVQTVKKAKKKKPVIVRILPWAGGLAAAAMIAVIVLPILILGSRGKKDATAQAKGVTLDMNAVTGQVNYESVPMYESAEETDGPVSRDAEPETVGETQGETNAVPQSEDRRYLQQNMKDTKKDGAAGEDEGIIYVQILSTDSTTGKVTIAAVLDLEDLINPDPSLEIETCKIKVAKESKETVKVKGIYKATITEDGEVLLLESIE